MSQMTIVVLLSFAHPPELHAVRLRALLNGRSSSFDGKLSAHPHIQAQDPKKDKKRVEEGSAVFEPIAPPGGKKSSAGRKVSKGNVEAIEELQGSIFYFIFFVLL